jgi:hypothetical protein
VRCWSGRGHKRLWFCAWHHSHLDADLAGVLSRDGFKKLSGFAACFRAQNQNVNFRMLLDELEKPLPPVCHARAGVLDGSGQFFGIIDDDQK